MSIDISWVKKNQEEPQIRILVCRNCKTIDELPDFEGRPEDDVILNLTVDKHQRPTPHTGLLIKFPIKFWAVPSIKEQIIQQIQGGASGLDVFGTNFYSTRMTFAEDAMTCYKDHLRPKGQCPDYKTDKKQLKPDTAKERREAGLDKPGVTGPKVYLCDFCPVKSFNQEKAFTEKGLYK